MTTPALQRELRKLLEKAHQQNGWPGIARAMAKPFKTRLEYHLLAPRLMGTFEEDPEWAMETQTTPAFTLNRRVLGHGLQVVSETLPPDIDRPALTLPGVGSWIAPQELPDHVDKEEPGALLVEALTFAHLFKHKVITSLVRVPEIVRTGWVATYGAKQVFAAPWIHRGHVYVFGPREDTGRFAFTTNVTFKGEVEGRAFLEFKAMWTAEPLKGVRLLNLELPEDGTL